MNTWEVEQAARIGKAVKNLRGDKTGQWLADRTAELGVKMTRQTITDLENGRRRYVTTAELAVLAAALNVPPIALLYPGPDYGEYVQVLPGVLTPTIQAVQWFSGLRDHGFILAPSGAEEARTRADYRESIRELQLWRELVDVQRKISSVTVPARRVNGEVVVGELSAAQSALLTELHDREYSLKMQLGVEVVDGG